jgi:Skp family chaperone for outer membrane proteins
VPDAQPDRLPVPVARRARTLPERRRTAPITLHEIEEEIQRLGEELERSTEDFETAILDAAEKEVAFKKAHAAAYLRAKGAVKEREAWADYRTEGQMRDYKIADALVKSARERLLTFRAHIDWLRSLGANVRAQT